MISKPADEIIAQAGKGAFIDVGAKTPIVVGFKNIRDILNIINFFGNPRKFGQQTTDITGIATGYRDLDHDDRSSRGGVNYPKGAPAVGKTALLWTLPVNIGTKLAKTVAIFSLEMGAESLWP